LTFVPCPLLASSQKTTERKEQENKTKGKEEVEKERKRKNKWHVQLHGKKRQVPAHHTK
jgi:hypothetical protein